MNPNASNPIDINHTAAKIPLVSTFADDPSMAELICLFIDNLPDRCERLTRAWETQDLDELETVTHQLKGAAGGYGFAPIGHAAARANDLVRELANEMVRTPGALKEAINELVDLCNRSTATTS